MRQWKCRIKRTRLRVSFITVCVTLSLGIPGLFIYLFCFLGPRLRHMDVPRPGVGSELQLPAYATVTATPDPSCICNLRLSLHPGRILNPLREAGDRTRILMDTMRVFKPLSHNRNSLCNLFSETGLLGARFFSPTVLPNQLV